MAPAPPCTSLGVPKDTELLAQLLLLLLPPLVVGHFSKKLVPLVVVQLVWGIICGPTVFQAHMKSQYTWMFGPRDLPGLQGAAFWGSILFLFFTGMHIDYRVFSQKASRVYIWVLGLTSMLTPFALGCAFGKLILEHFPESAAIKPAKVPPAAFILSIGITTGVTALPVLSSMLLEMNLLDTPFGRYVTACATTHDAILWTLMAVVMSLVTGDDAVATSFTTPTFAGKYQAIVVIAFLMFIVLVLFFGFNPLMNKIIETSYWKQQSQVTHLMVIMVCLALFALMTDIINVHALLGSVLFGAALPRALKPFASAQTEVLNRSLMLPLYFGSIGQKFLIGNDPHTWYMMLGLVSCTVIGCCISVIPIGRYVLKYPWSTTLSAAACMQCKGVVETTVALALYQGNVIGQQTFSAIIMNAVVCTAISKPWLYAVQRLSKDGLAMYEYGIQDDGFVKNDSMNVRDLMTVQVERPHMVRSTDDGDSVIDKVEMAQMQGPSL